MSKGMIIEPSSSGLDKATSKRIQILGDLKHVWNLVNDQVRGDIVWATDAELPTAIEDDFVAKNLGWVQNSVKYLSPGNLQYPKDFPVPGFAVSIDTYGPSKKYPSFDFVPMLVFSRPTEISKTYIQNYKIDNLKNEKGLQPVDYSNLDGLLQKMKVPEAFVVEVGAFLPMAGEGQSYETQFVPSAYCFNSDFHFATVVDKTHTGNSWATEKDRPQNLEDISNPKKPKLFKAEYRLLNEQKATIDDTSNQLIVVAQSGYIPRERIVAPALPYEGDMLGMTLKSAGMGSVIDKPKIVEGSETGTNTVKVEFEESKHPAVVYHVHVFGVTKVDLPRINPQKFSDFIKPVYK